MKRAISAAAAVALAGAAGLLVERHNTHATPKSWRAPSRRLMARKGEDRYPPKGSVPGSVRRANLRGQVPA